MAIAVDNTGTASSTGTLTVTLAGFTITGSKICLIVSVCDQSPSGTTTGVTANGVAMTQINTNQTVAGNYGVTLWGLYGATSGNIVATRTGTGDRITVCAVSYTGVSNTTAIGSLINTRGGGTATTLTGTLTTPTANCWTVMGTYVSSGGDTTTAGSGTTKRVTGPEIEDQWDSGGPIATSSSTTLNVNNGGSFAYGYIMAAIEPDAGAKLLNLLGVGT